MPRRPPNRVRYPRNNMHHFYSCVYCNNCVLNVPGNNGNAVALQRRVVEHGDVVMCDARQTVNVRFNSQPNRRFHNRLPVVNVKCNQCNGQIGERVTLLGQINCEPVLLFR
ncbi:hypothetical protein V6N11_034747 [Hibiscus sabdariffa]|uniref:Protein yippee-like n=1 Tax=Hibiscus sabdariffa TaxID=183260 RepID=A0ABR2NRP0_9ROSI